MLDEIINYVQSIQKQVEFGFQQFLSMKLATVNPGLDFNVDNVCTKEIFQSSTSEFPALGCSLVNSAYYQLNWMDQVVSYCGLDIGINSTEMGLRSISAPISVPETFMDSSCFNVISSDLSSLFHSNSC
ncbi:hypothetical protein L1987_15703 [Smallanthus sonchifolius]|uniref:Uncharacterized protein n=1 Tax=Smallanthus sonchifolius TaxID=185202 RepID=A0ACB9J8L2_9ASTR|nr:hypothetical protein L1987_15703 [Smallanthus sonchifolius]